jgi:hypothetical protein
VLLHERRRNPRPLGRGGCQVTHSHLNFNSGKIFIAKKAFFPHSWFLRAECRIFSLDRFLRHNHWYLLYIFNTIVIAYATKRKN